MRTPGHDFELAAGMMAGQGVLAGTELSQVAYCTDVTLAPEEEFNVVTVTLASPPLAPPSVRTSTLLATSSACGVCGTESIDEVMTLAARRADGAAPDHPVLSPELLSALPDRLREHQRVFNTTGGLHAAAAVDADGTLTEVREDIGRHNALDKVIGARVLAGRSPAVPVMLVSGRIGFELVQKAAVVGRRRARRDRCPLLAGGPAGRGGRPRSGRVPEREALRRLRRARLPRRVTRILSVGVPTV